MRLNCQIPPNLLQVKFASNLQTALDFYDGLQKRVKTRKKLKAILAFFQSFCALFILSILVLCPISFFQNARL
jgi:hypothetical protein